MWANCRLYNQDGSDIVQTADDLARRFLAAWQKRGLPVTAPRPASQHPAAPDTGAHPPSTAMSRAAPDLLPVDTALQRAPLSSRPKVLMPQPVASSQVEWPAANGHAQQRLSRHRSRPAGRSNSALCAADNKSHAENDHAPDRAEADGTLEPPPLTAISSAAQPAAGKEAQRRPSLKITLGHRSASATAVPAAKQETQHGRLTVKLRTASAGFSKPEPP